MTSPQTKSRSMWDHCPVELLTYIFSLLPSDDDRKTASLVCKRWCLADAQGRSRIKVRNCFAVAPVRLIRRFTELKYLTLSGQPDVHDFRLMPEYWGRDGNVWIQSLAASCVGLVELKLKRMLVNDRMLQLISRSFPNLQSLIVIRCGDFSNDSLVHIATNCRRLQVLHLEDRGIEKKQWLARFPQSCTSLVSLSIICHGELDLEGLQRLVLQCQNLTIIRLIIDVPHETVQRILEIAPRLVHLGIGSDGEVSNSEVFSNAIGNCLLVQNLSGMWRTTCLPLLQPLCARLLSLDLTISLEDVQRSHLIAFVGQCINLQRFEVSERVGDPVLRKLGDSCKNLQELKLHQEKGGARNLVLFQHVTGKGLIAVSSGCPKLHSVTFNCHRMSNTALVEAAKTLPNLTTFKLCSTRMGTQFPPLDEGIRAIVKFCTNLKQLSIYGFCLTDQILIDINMYAAKLEKLSVAITGEDESGLLYALRNCPKLRQVVIRDCPIGDTALLSAAQDIKKLQLFWLPRPNVTAGCCRELARKIPTMNVEIMDAECCTGEPTDADIRIPKLFIYQGTDRPPLL